MEDQELSGVRQSPAARAATGYFGRMLVFSLLAHALFSTAFILTHRGGPGGPPVQYLDLKMTEPAVSSPSQESVADTATQEEEPAPTASPTVQQERPQPVAPPAREAVEPQPFQQGSLGFGIVNGHFGSISDGRTLRDDMREYYLGMLARFNETWWQMRSKIENTQGAMFLVVVARDGSIVDMKLLQSSGNSSYDRAMLQALKAAGPLNPLPQSFESDFFSAPLRFVAPLNLMSPFSG